MPANDDPFALSRRTVTCLVRTASGRDDYGNTTYTTTEVDVPGCLVAPGGSQDDNTDADRNTDAATVYDHGANWPGGTVNRVRIDGQTWEVDGTPQRWSLGTEIKLRKMEG